MNKILTIGNSDFVLGFRSAGIQGYIIDDPKQAKKLLHDLSNQGDVAIIFVGESIAEPIIDFIDKLNVEKTLPSIMVLSDTISQKDISGIALQKSIQRAVGIDLTKERKK